MTTLLFICALLLLLWLIDGPRGGLGGALIKAAPKPTPIHWPSRARHI